MWDQRYSVKEYVYGTEANVFFKEQLEKLPAGKILLPGDGEGRNAVFAASIGWEVVAFDPSIEGRKKALKLAKSQNVKIRYELNTYQDFNYKASPFDAIGLFFTHQASEMTTIFHRSLKDCLKPGGIIILESFNKKQIHRNTGGPKNIDFLLSEEELRNDFSYLKELKITEKVRTLDEGPFHQGDASIIQLIGSL